MIPAVIIQLSAPVLLVDAVFAEALLRKGALVYLIFAGLLTANALLNTISDIYNASELSRRAPITGFIQVVKSYTNLHIFI